MTAYKAPLDDLRFALFDVLGAEKTPCPVAKPTVATCSMPCWKKPAA
jgi:hypothetical protein